MIKSWRNFYEESWEAQDNETDDARLDSHCQDTFRYKCAPIESSLLLHLKKSFTSIAKIAAVVNSEKFVWENDTFLKPDKSLLLLEVKQKDAA